MATDEWVTYNGTEIINLARTVQLAQALGVSSLRTDLASVQWVEMALGGTGYDDITQAPWYDSGHAASAEFAGIVPLAIPQLDDSTREATTTEYITDGGNSGSPRNKTLAIVASVVLVASTDRGADFGKRWLDRVLAGGGTQMFCSGSELRYFQYTPPEDEPSTVPPQVHRRDVSTTRAISVTRKWRSDCASLWTITFTLTANDPFEYGDEQPQVFGLGGDLPTDLPNRNEANPVPTTLTGYTISAGAVQTIVGGYIRVAANAASVDTFTAPGGTAATLKFGMQAGGTYTVSAQGGAFVAGTGPADARARRIVVYHRIGAGVYTGLLSSALTAPGDRVSLTFTLPAGTTEVQIRLYFGYSTSGYQEWRNITVTEGSVAALPLATSEFGNQVLVEASCPAWDYSPLDDPLYPTLVPPPSAPVYYPDGWNIEDGLSFKRYWARLEPVEPSTLNLVPVVEFTTGVDARMVRFTVWPDATDPSDLCGWLWSVILTYQPTGQTLYVDGEQKATYAWDGVSPIVRRADGLSYGPQATPVDWLAFNDPAGLLVSLDLFDKGGGVYEGNGTLRAGLSLVPKSD